MKHRIAWFTATALVTFTSACWAIGPNVKHDKLEITDLIEQSISVVYTNRGGDQAFDVKSVGIVSFESGETKAWLLPVLNGNADNHPLRSGHCDVLIYKADSDYVTPIKMTPISLDVGHDDECIGFKRPLIVDGDNNGTSQLVIYPTIYANQPKATVWRVLAYDAPNRSFCYAPDASDSLTKAAGEVSINDSNARSVLESLHLPADAFKCAVPTKVD
ncbi:hypothetical protein LMG28688_07019 [Paraburkholderia caffeinitolerans]|uniref:Lipoprotein n=1 Tax=Paraburkholderia caffeinitolerans TaxID=1723730 RepID=A0A6J5GZM5_9BURK|nr:MULTISPECIES: hypothetical protein [Paraburkholderia]CAB3809567.1 hypothetical protein LMG28688_07019 [Paraburkholderia caffeinitolerans]